MGRSIFGWDYPPGCNSVPGDEMEGPCNVCGGFVDSPGPYPCICPECPECGGYGDPYCYVWHSLRRTEEQKFQHEIMEREIEAAIRAENKFWDAWMDEKGDWADEWK